MRHEEIYIEPFENACHQLSKAWMHLIETNDFTDFAERRIGRIQGSPKGTLSMFALAPRSTFGSEEHFLVYAFRHTPNINQVACRLRLGSSVTRARSIASTRRDNLSIPSGTVRQAMPNHVAPIRCSMGEWPPGTLIDRSVPNL